MASASAALARGDDQAASRGEREALRDLQSGGQQMSSTLAANGRASGGAVSLVPGMAAPGEGDGGDAGDDTASEGTGHAGGGRDPLGRALDGHGSAGSDDAELALPDDTARARSRQLEEELRRRDSDRERPKQELDYLGRLLRSF